MSLFIIKCICVSFSGIGFGLIVNLPHRALNVAGITATLSWLVYYAIMNTWGGLGSANFFGGLRNCLRSSLNFDILLQKGHYDD